jgi:hypothetical protein
MTLDLFDQIRHDLALSDGASLLSGFAGSLNIRTHYTELRPVVLDSHLSDRRLAMSASSSSTR